MRGRFFVLWSVLLLGCGSGPRAERPRRAARGPAPAAVVPATGCEAPLSTRSGDPLASSWSAEIPLAHGEMVEGFFLGERAVVGLVIHPGVESYALRGVMPDGTWSARFDPPGDANGNGVCDDDEADTCWPEMVSAREVSFDGSGRTVVAPTGDGRLVGIDARSGARMFEATIPDSWRLVGIVPSGADAVTGLLQHRDDRLARFDLSVSSCGRRCAVTMTELPTTSLVGTHAMIAMRCDDLAVGSPEGFGLFGHDGEVRAAVSRPMRSPSNLQVMPTGEVVAGRFDVATVWRAEACSGDPDQCVRDVPLRTPDVLDTDGLIVREGDRWVTWSRDYDGVVPIPAQLGRPWAILTCADPDGAMAACVVHIDGGEPLEVLLPSHPGAPEIVLGLVLDGDRIVAVRSVDPEVGPLYVDVIALGDRARPRIGPWPEFSAL